MKNTSDNSSNRRTGFGSLLMLGALTAMLGFTGCVSPATSSRIIVIESLPPGVRVEVNGEDLGRTPTTYKVKANKKGDFVGVMGESPLIMFTAYPEENAKDQYKQMKGFSPSAFMEKGDRVPEKIFFDMHNASGR